MSALSLELVLDQGRAGLERHAHSARHVVILDTFCFSTPIDIALNRGAVVFAAPSDDSAALGLANTQQMFTKLEALQFGERFNLHPTPAGALSRAAYEILRKAGQIDQKSVISACFRNAAAVCEWIQARPGQVLLLSGSSHAGAENLPLEDLLVAGAIAAGIPGDKSKTVLYAHATFVAAINAGLYSRLAETNMAKQFIDHGMERNLRSIAELDVSACVPLYDQFGAFASF